MKIKPVLKDKIIVAEIADVKAYYIGYSQASPINGKFYELFSDKPENAAVMTKDHAEWIIPTLRKQTRMFMTIQTI